MTSEQANGRVFIIDDDPLVRASLEAVLSCAGFATEKFASASYFLTCVTSAYVGCALADFRMPGIDGLQLQEELARRNSPLSVIILTGYADVSLAVRAVKNGAFDLLEKPFKRSQLIDQVATGIALSKEKFLQMRATEERQARLSGLTDREREVAEFLLAGRTNREIAESLRLSPRTVENHRARLMEKLAVRNLPELLRVVGRPN